MSGDEMPTYLTVCQNGHRRSVQMLLIGCTPDDVQVRCPECWTLATVHDLSDDATAAVIRAWKHYTATQPNRDWWSRELRTFAATMDRLVADTAVES